MNQRIIHLGAVIPAQWAAWSTWNFLGSCICSSLDWFPMRVWYIRVIHKNIWGPNHTGWKANTFHSSIAGFIPWQCIIAPFLPRENGVWTLFPRHWIYPYFPLSFDLCLNLTGLFLFLSEHTYFISWLLDISSITDYILYYLLSK